MPPEATPAPSAADFNQAFSASASPGIRRVWELAEPGLPAEIEPFSFVSAGLLRHDALLADLQDEARQQLPLAGLKDRVVVIATAP